jgi:alpha-beta hydrolase superfamily lysophospholipase
LAVISSGFLVGSDQYRTYAERLASYGYVAVCYDKVENATNAINDELSALFVSEIINWLASTPEVKTDSGVYCVGHSRGGKISLLAAENDERIGAVCLIDPVDSNDYAPEGPGYPSAIKRLRTSPLTNELPIAIIGGGRSSDCIPRKANYERFFEGSPSPLTMMLGINEAGHFQFLDKTSMIQAAVCSGGKVEDQAVRDLSKAAMIAWAESTLPHDGGMVDPNPLDRMKSSVDSMTAILKKTYGIQEEAINLQFRTKE